jgi:hypothetical protein
MIVTSRLTAEQQAKTARGAVLSCAQLTFTRGGKGTVFTESVPCAVFEKVGDDFIWLLRGQ